jgi:hypothetical protein
MPLRYKLGKHRPKVDDRTLKFGAYLKPTLPSPPSSADWSKAVKTGWGMMKNDTYGDCTCAAAGHMIMDWTANNDSEFVVPDNLIVEFYNHFAHGNADAGANMLDVLKYWRSHGLDKHKIDAFAGLEPRNHLQVQDAIYLFGGCYIGVALPDFAVAEGVDLLKVPWVVPPQGAVGKAAPDPNNGHCIPAFAYDQRNVYVVTWGQVKAMSWQFYDAYADEAFAVLSPDWFGKSGQAPPGFDLAALQSDLSAITQG